MTTKKETIEDWFKNLMKPIKPQGKDSMNRNAAKQLKSLLLSTEKKKKKKTPKK
jgi:hypothetical protein